MVCQLLSSNPDEIAHIEIDYTNAPYKEEYLKALELWHNTYEDDIEMYCLPDDNLVCSTRYMKQLPPPNSKQTI